MILVDLSSVIYSNVNIQPSSIDLNEDFLRHLILDSLRSIRTKFKDKYGELVICCDSGNYWRKDIFPFYKALREEARDKSKIDWPKIFLYVNKIRKEIDKFFPYRFIKVDKAEADDIIAVLVELHTYEGFLCKKSTEPILIASSDKDFIQLHCQGIDQYDSIRSRWISHQNPSRYLFEHIVRGDSGDGIPNIKSPDNCFVNKIRQNRITEKWLSQLEGLDDPSHPLHRNYMRNKNLIDLSMIPDSIKSSIKDMFENQKQRDRKFLFNYFKENKLKYLMGRINEF